ncbi:MAG TPA: glycoside hydrolase family 3 protein [Vicinamibacterales bacterium]|jgi:beta-N-acetylhexosaminidase|nr:glycoside hydrolase family 3 protein [Vicinamibacterales bacterium]
MRVAISAFTLALAIGVAANGPDPLALDKAGERWVDATLKKMTLDQKVGQLLVPSFESTFLPSDGDGYEALAKLVHEAHVGGFHAFGGSELAPQVLLNPNYGTVTLGQGLAAASVLNRLQAISPIPLLNTADFEAGVGFRIAGATLFPRAMAFGAAGDERLAYEAGRITAIETRALGIHVNFAPVVDVNNNARNPVINTRSFGEDPARVGALASAYVRGLQANGVFAALKHFPGHGDTSVDSHLGLPIIRSSRERLDAVELPPFRAGIAAGARAIMTGHIEMPVLDPMKGIPTTLSAPIVSGMLRDEIGFRGLVYTDSMQMHGVTAQFTPGEAAVRAILAGNDVVLHSADNAAAFLALKTAVEQKVIAEARLVASVNRLLRAKALAGLHRTKAVSLDAIATQVGSRAHKAVAREVSQRAITLIKDAPIDGGAGAVPLKVPRSAALLYLSVLDYPGGWRIAAPSRTFIPALRERWPDVTAVELSDRTTASELELVRAMAPRFDAIVASVFVRAASSSGRMDLPPTLVRILQDLARAAARAKRPYVTVLFGNPYTATFLPDVPAVMLTYDFYDMAEESAVRALAGEAPITGRLPIALPGLFEAGHGLAR